MVAEEKDRDSSKEKHIDSRAFGPEVENGGTNITGLLSERIENLVQAIDEIDTALIQRRALNERFLEQIKQEREEIKRHLNFLNEPWKTGFYPELEFLRLSFHKSLTSRAKDSRRYFKPCLNLGSTIFFFSLENNAINTAAPK